MMRNEADVARRVVEHMFAQGVDRVYVLENLSTDDTLEQLLASDGAGDLIIIDDPEPGYYQADKMTGLAYRAAEDGAQWIVPFDADEVWYGTGGRTIRDALTNTTADVVVATGWDHIARHADPAGHPFDVIQWRRPRHQQLPKVAFRPHKNMRLAQGNHMVRHPGHHTFDVLAYRHFQYRTLSQMIAKVRVGAAAYENTELADTEGAHWRRLAALTDDELEAHWLDLCSSTDLIHDPAPVAR